MKPTFTQQIIQDLERRAAAVGISVRELCARANSAPSTFSRWKHNRVSPLLITVDRMHVILTELEEAKAKQQADSQEQAST
jgi:predicted transcriptional regulator